MKLMTIFSAICVAAMLFPATGYGGTVYKWTDRYGNVHYTQKPPSSGPYETINQGADSSTSSTSPYGVKREQPEPSTSGSKPAPSSGGGSSSGSDTVDKTIAEGQELREKNCVNAKKNLQLYTTHKRFKDKDGNVYRMDDDERAKLIEESKQQVEEFCD